MKTEFRAEAQATRDPEPWYRCRISKGKAKIKGRRISDKSKLDTEGLYSRESGVFDFNHSEPSAIPWVPFERKDDKPTFNLW
jgi:hypothetical protein